ncbi:hypothetical protein ACH5RR_012300 [Cinchona calisaya]|uniref:Uncharacterized protein n=1 Tax=Cinchona calisaya TaxID=153742 RepID=A0ABD3A8W7_9GENT
MVQVGDQQFSTLSASSIKRTHVGNMAPIACNVVQVGDQRFPALSASSIKRAHVGNISRPSGHIQTALPFEEVPYSKSAIPIGRSPYLILVPFERKDLNRKGAYLNGGSFSPNVGFYEKRSAANVDCKSPQLGRIVHFGEVKVLYQVRPIQPFMPQVQRNKLPILRDGRTFLGPKENFYSKNIVNTMMVEVKSVEPLELGNQDGTKETEKIHSNETLGNNKSGTNTNKKKQKGGKKTKEGQDSSTGSNIGIVERNPAKGKGVMTSQDGQRLITRSMSKGVTIGENMQIPIEESSSKEISSPIKDSRKQPVMATQIKNNGKEKLLYEAWNKAQEKISTLMAEVESLNAKLSQQ